MPNTISLQLWLIWLACSFAAGLGFASGAWIVGRIFGLFVNGPL